MKTIDRIFGWLMVLGTCGHTTGTFLLTEPMSGIFVWSLGASIAGFLLGALNIVRAGRPEDKTLAIITAAGTTLWLLLALLFGKSIHNLLDPRVIANLLIALPLILFSLRTIRNAPATLAP